MYLKSIIKIYILMIFKILKIKNHYLIQQLKPKRKISHQPILIQVKEVLQLNALKIKNNSHNHL